MMYYRITLMNNDVQDITLTPAIEQRILAIVNLEKRKAGFTTETSAIRRALSIISGHVVVSWKLIKFPDEIPAIDFKTRAAGDE